MKIFAVECLSNKLPTKLFLGAFVAGQLLFSTASHAQLISNYPFVNSSAGVNMNVVGSGAAVGFTMPNQDYTVDSVVLRLNGYATPADSPEIGFYDNNSGKPGTLIGSFLNFPSSSDTSTANFTFTPASTITLAANQTYWLWVKTSAGLFNWRSDNPATTPTGAATHFDYMTTSNGGTTWTSHLSQIGTYQINATPVPEPEQVAVAVGLLLCGFAGYRRFRQPAQTR